ncbi:hypothetical protein HNY73_018826 [Argiope bruennichi]|uniref:Uncharacterized protein n=1 Tax=Argiope bruennichi TaxID=94029 RepID=A0A8T0EES9_ARGBR|nr:hypothetical protein HNY73_018826 [Argiope bruennichi]
MDYWNSIIPLEDKALIKVTQKFCENRSFKEAVLGFACVYPQNESYYVTDEEREEIRRHFYSSTAESYAAFIRARYVRYERSLYRWETVMEEYIQRILSNTKELPQYFHDEAKEWISRHILEYLSYCRRLEVLTGLSRYFFVDFVTAEDWNVEGRLDEKSLAERLIANERLTVLQRYRIACTYCLTNLRRRLWWKLTQEERNSLNQNDDPLLTFEYNRSVLFWSYHMKGGKHYIVTGEADPWLGAAEIAVYDGNVFALRESWKNIQSHRQGAEASDMAFRCLNQWKICKASDWKRKLLALDCYSSPWSFSDFCLPTHYARMISFFFKNMDEDELEMFFEELLLRRKDWGALIYFLDWPNLDYFLPTLRLLQGFIPDEALKMVYLESLLYLASRHQTQEELTSPNKIRINGFYDYRTVLRQLWDETPAKYKRYAFKDIMEPNISDRYAFLIMLLGKNPFLEKDEWLFIRVFRDATVKEKKVFLMSSKWKQIFVTLVLRENWSLLDWFTKESFDEEENAVFRRWNITSSFGSGFCFDLLLQNKEVLLNNLIRWSLKSEDERKRFKHNLMYALPHIDVCLTLISEDKFSQVERMMNFCLENTEIQIFKERLANDDAFYSLILNHEWAVLNRYVAWCFESEEKIVKFKKKYFSGDGVDLYFHFVFREHLYEVQKFYQWFDLSPEEIEKLKKDTVFSFQSVDYILGLLYSMEPLPVVLLLWSLQDKKVIQDFKKTLQSYLTDDSNETKMAEYKLHGLVELLLSLKGMNSKVSDISGQ